MNAEAERVVMAAVNEAAAIAAAAEDRFATACEALGAARARLARAEAAIDATTSATPEATVANLIEEQAVAARRVEHAEKDERRASRELDLARLDRGKASQRAKDGFIPKGVEKILAIEGKARRLREELAKLEEEQARVFREEMRPFMPWWERADFRSIPPPNVYESVAHVVDKHSTAIKPDRTWLGWAPIAQVMHDLHAKQNAEEVKKDASRLAAKEASFATEFDDDAKLRLKHSLDCLGIEFASVVFAEQLTPVSNPPLAALYALAGERFDRPGRHPATTPLPKNYAGIEPEALALILHAVSEEGPAFRRACARKAFDKKAVRRGLGEYVAPAPPPPPEAA